MLWIASAAALICTILLDHQQTQFRSMGTQQFIDIRPQGAALLVDEHLLDQGEGYYMAQTMRTCR